jgi:cytidylate kinase
MSSSAASRERPPALRIAISGKSGCGNSTVSRIVARRLGLRVINYTFKDLARDRGVSFDEICRLAETDSQYDLTIDRMQVELAREDGFVLGSRLAIWLLREHAFTVYLHASLATRARRRQGTAAITIDTSVCMGGMSTGRILPRSRSTRNPSARSRSRR